MKAKTTLHIYAKNSRPNLNGHCPIYVRLTIDGKRIEFSTKKYVDPAKWLPEASKMKGNTEEACSLNSYLEIIKARILDIQMELIHTREPIANSSYIDHPIPV